MLPQKKETRNSTDLYHSFGLMIHSSRHRFYLLHTSTVIIIIIFISEKESTEIKHASLDSVVSRDGGFISQLYGVPHGVLLHQLGTVPSGGCNVLPGRRRPVPLHPSHVLLRQNRFTRRTRSPCTSGMMTRCTLGLMI